MSPVLNDDGKIKLGLNVEVSDIGDAEILGTKDEPTARAYPLTKRSTSTQLYLNNGQTLAISGLIKQKSEEQLRKFPWLGEVPVLGVFFRSRTNKTGSGNEVMGDTELVIMVTPSLVEDDTQNQKDLEKKNKIAGTGKAAGAGFESGKKQVSKLEESGKNPGEKDSTAKGISSPEKNKGMTVSRSSSFPGDKSSDQKISPPLSEDADISRNPTEGYIHQVIAYLMNNILYPWAAKEAELEGTVVLNLHLAKSGDLLESNVGNSSGYSVLDENAVRVARQIAPYPSFPAAISEQDLWVQIPVVYNLKEKR